MRVAVVQTKPEFGEVRQNVLHAISMMDKVKADLFVLPELFNTGYNFVDIREVRKFAEDPKGATYSLLSRWAKKKKCYVCYGFAEKGKKLFNSSALIGPRGLIGIYRKVHLYYREKLFFAPGDLGFPVFKLPFGNVGMMICFDWIFPESARTLALAGAEIVLHPSNLVLPHCPDAMVTRALENRVFTVTANRIGTENRGGIRLSFIGKSEIVSPKGKILSRLRTRKTGVGVVTIDPLAARNKNVNEYNHLFEDRRLGQYTIV
jgi:predicted amidohydrolase